MHHYVLHLNDFGHHRTPSLTEKIMKRLGICLLFIFTHVSYAAHTELNVYLWGSEIPHSLVHDFEKQTGIKVHFSTYDANETMYTKIRAASQEKVGVYDIIMPSGYFVERMRKQGLLQVLDHQRIQHLENIDPTFLNSPYDPNNQYSLPMVWGTSGIFYNTHFVHPVPKNWNDLWDNRFKNQLLLLDDSREIFAMAMLSLHYSPDDSDPKHIHQAFEKLLALAPNIKLFASDGIQAILVDEDANVGLVWNGDAYKGHTENKAVAYYYPKEGFIIWVDCLAIPANAPHVDAAYAFINYLLDPKVAAKVTLAQGLATANRDAKALLPETIQNNPMIFPDAETLKHGSFQRDVGEKTIELYNQYWQALKLSL